MLKSPKTAHVAHVEASLWIARLDIDEEFDVRIRGSNPYAPTLTYLAEVRDAAEESMPTTPDLFGAALKRMPYASSAVLRSADHGQNPGCITASI
eukprot:6209395-Pleurochrysis_carterae.AAC.2